MHQDTLAQIPLTKNRQNRLLGLHQLFSQSSVSCSCHSWEKLGLYIYHLLTNESYLYSGKAAESFVKNVTFVFVFLFDIFKYNLRNFSFSLRLHLVRSTLQCGDRDRVKICLFPMNKLDARLLHSVCM